MAEEKDTAPADGIEEMVGATPGGKKSKKKKLVAGIVGAVVVVQGAIVGVAKMSGLGPDEVAAAEARLGLEARKEADPVYQEIFVTEFRAPNEKSRRMYVYEMKVAVQVEEKNLGQVQELVACRKAALEDAFNRVVRSADPEDLRQDDLQWLRAQFLFEFDRVAKTKGLVNRLYIPRFMKRPVD